MLGTEITMVDSSSPERVGRAIKKVNQTPGLRIKSGADPLWALYKAPEHTLRRVELEAKFGAFDLHFGWFCRRVAEELGANKPDVLALVDYAVDEHGKQILTLKPAVVAGMDAARKVRGPLPR